MTTKEKAITIAINTFLSEYDNDAVKTYEMLSNELADSFDCIDYATIWEKFEDDTISEVVEYMDNLIDSIVKAFD
jgi:hypothetical protein